MKKLLLTCLVLLTACATIPGSVKVFDQNSPVSVNNFDDKNANVVIKFTGPIEKETQEDLQIIMADVISSGHKTFTIELDSGGGDQEATDMLNSMFYMLHKVHPDINITTYVNGSSECNSGCTALFALGDKRVAELGAIFAFHYGTGGNSPEKYYNNISTFRQVIDMCGVDNELVDAVLDTDNVTKIYNSQDLIKVCPAYITELKIGE